jgi:peroxiredoxin family protein
VKVENRMKLEEYVQIGNTLKDIREILYKYPQIHGKTSPFEKQRKKADDAMSKLQCSLEEMMYLECLKELRELGVKMFPCGAHLDIASHIFYGCDERINLTEMKVEKRETK